MLFRGNNHFVAKLAILELINRGIKDYCICPGSQSYPLTLAISEIQEAKTYSHFDERGAGFYALGLAKARKNPVAIITSSGTAVGNLLPAVMEAFHSETPLIIITADREDSWQNRGKDQTCNQIGIFGSYTVYNYTFSVNDDCKFSSDNLQEAIDDAYKQSIKYSKPIHLNFRFTRPLFSEYADFNFKLGKIEEVPKDNFEPDYELFNNISKLISQSKKGVILAGELDSQEDIDAIRRIVKQLNWPIIPEINSQLRFDVQDEGSELLTHAHWYLKNNQPIYPDIILQFGKRTIQLMNKVTEYLDDSNSERICVTTSFDQGEDIVYLPCRVVEFEKLVKIQATPSDLLNFSSFEIKARNYLQNLDQLKELSELHIVRKIFQLSPEYETVFLGNSLPVRHASWAVSPTNKKLRVISNRGLSGIDGNIATCAGYSVLNQNLTAIIGDLTALHDLNSLSMFSPNSDQGKDRRAIIVIINNSGGGIFAFLPQLSFNEKAKDLTLTEHNFNFLHAAQQFGLNYYMPKDICEFEDNYNSATLKSNSSIIEVFIDKNNTKQIIEQIEKEINI